MILSSTFFVVLSLQVLLALAVPAGNEEAPESRDIYDTIEQGLEFIGEGIGEGIVEGVGEAIGKALQGRFPILPFFLSDHYVIYLHPKSFRHRKNVIDFPEKGGQFQNTHDLKGPEYPGQIGTLAASEVSEEIFPHIGPIEPIGIDPDIIVLSINRYATVRNENNGSRLSAEQHAAVRRERRAVQTAEQQEAANDEVRNRRAVQPAEQLDARNAVLGCRKLGGGQKLNRELLLAG
ncbi:unnamed protein product [Darwinula stevensoni]|uniref:Uncharacterized protein n=1 Tax=Darwinula stevensoni TaxID=69355 RepID=A0A7R9ABE8_9CRUS|nr:unnamed protein product [Darwinula stevensoni]CAG0899157.1 unnamed protein product [Darwinula stevensoni]